MNRRMQVRLIPWAFPSAVADGRAIRGSAIAPLPKGNGCAAATIPNAFLLTKYQYNIGTMHIDIACHQTIQNYQK